MGDTLPEIVNFCGFLFLLVHHVGSALLNTHGFVHSDFKDATKILKARQTRTADKQVLEPSPASEALEAGCHLGPQNCRGATDVLPAKDKCEHLTTPNESLQTRTSKTLGMNPVLSLMCLDWRMWMKSELILKAESLKYFANIVDLDVFEICYSSLLS